MLARHSSRQVQRALTMPVAVVVAFLLCVALNLLLLNWIRSGPPGGKGDSFFLELVVLISAVFIAGIVTIVSPARARPILPFIFVVLAWHTGFQINVTPDGRFVATDGSILVSTFDFILPLVLFFALLGGWYIQGSQVLQPLKRPIILFGLFCLWGLCLALARAVPPAPLIANLKAFVIYPLIAPILVWCIRTWRQLYYTVGLLLVLVFLRVLDGLRQGGTSSFKIMVGTNIVSRINGHMADVNQYAFYIMSGLLIMLALAVAGRSTRLRIILVPAILATSVALLDTLSRGAWLGTAAGLLALALMLRMRRAVVLVGIVVVVVALIQILQPGASSTVTQRIRQQTVSTDVRVDYLNLGLQVVRHYPLGAGWGAAFNQSAGQLTPSTDSTVFPWYHNDYVQLATEISIPGVLVFLWILFAILRTGFVATRETPDATSNAVIMGLVAAFAGMCVQANTDQFFWHADIAPHIWIVAGLCLAAVALSRSSSDVLPDTVEAFTPNRVLEAAGTSTGN